MADYIERIQKLLALAKSPNEYEARDALLKAWKLMAKHKVSQNQIKEAAEEKVIRKVTGITYSPRRDPWVYKLAQVIAGYHCCGHFQSREKGKQTAEIGFVGLSGDIPVCMEVFKYAVDCIRSMTRNIRKENGTQAANSYGFGFTVGLKDAYHKQQKEENWSLILVVPEAVNKAMGSMVKRAPGRSLNPQYTDARTFYKGVVDGHKFHEQKRIAHKSA